AILDAFGWADIVPKYDFVLDYEESDEQESPAGRKRKEPWRYRWRDEDRDEVLARLLDLNRQRAADGAAVKKAERPTASASAAKAKRAKKKSDDQPSLYTMGESA